ncbi:aspartate--ammonia ligase [Isachenkonia alkalipeptolytica]|uniref:Aspartate--ammonia ligase n=1 Tax=Isachenkonia alkalipeptolytica TaxID=2565777 RepID=A0AA43XLE3_9CLOT|nr:aspartate--ammonia ligase [Isachenkonia alkalipeptolytica]NBG88040.1 aspartate--ammonia ligase [Isachenkonia alkalipeptolytica]
MNGEKKLILPEGYKTPLDIRETAVAIKKVKDHFERRLAMALNLTRVSAPLFVSPETGLNDNLNGIERPVAFDVKDLGHAPVEIVHSLAKWKRMALYRYGFHPGEGIYTDMNAIRRDEVLDNTHSVYVDQWDWERIVTKEERSKETLREMVEKLYRVFKDTEKLVTGTYPELRPTLPDEITFITAQELEDRFPKLSPKEREDAITKEKGAVFLMEIGKKLQSGEKHDGRAADYDDWSLNGDILFWFEPLQGALELTSMGIRVDGQSLLKQLEEKEETYKKDLEYHRMVLDNTLPLTIGGGIGQSRICMFFLQKAHIGEVQAGIWPKEMIETCHTHGIPLL